MPRMNYNNFIDDEEKVNDLLYLNKEEFLKSYSYITEAEYENTIKEPQPQYAGIRDCGS